MIYSRALENIVVALNTEIGCVRTNNTADSKTINFTWNNLNIHLGEHAVMKLVSIAHDAGTHATEHGDSILQFRLGGGVRYNPALFVSSDKGAPLIFASSFDAENQYNFSDIGGIYLEPQTINNITLSASDSLSDIAAGINKGLQFLIMLVIQPYDKKYSAIEN
jgi:hypothetical protein